MREARKKKAVVVTIMLTAIVLLMSPLATAGDLQPPSGPDIATSAMYTLEDLYNWLATGAPGEKRTGPANEPSDNNSTMHTIDDIMAAMPSSETNGPTSDEVECGMKFWGLSQDDWGMNCGRKCPPMWGWKYDINDNKCNYLYSDCIEDCVSDTIGKDPTVNCAPLCFYYTDAIEHLYGGYVLDCNCY